MAIRWSMTIPGPAMYSPVSSSKNELPSRPMETNEEIHQKLKLDRAIHLEKKEIFFKAIYSYIYIPGFSIGLGMASHGHQEAGVPMTYSGAGRVAQPKTKLSSSKNEFQIIPLRQMKKSTKSSSWIEQFIWKKYEIFFTAIYSYIYIPGFSIGLGMASHGHQKAGVSMTYSGAGHV